MNEKITITIAPEVKSKFPSLEVVYTVVPDVNVAALGGGLDERKKALIERWKGVTSEELHSVSEIKSYRDYFRKQRVDYKTISPAVENLLLRLLSKEKFPSINVIVDLCNVVSVENLLPVGVFDADMITGDVCLSFPGFGAHFTPISGLKKEIKNQKMLVLKDVEGIISIPCYRDSDRTKITDSTKNLLVLTLTVDGISSDKTNELLAKAKQELLSH